VLRCRIPGPAPCVTYSGEHAGMQVHIIWTGRDIEHGVDLIGTGAHFAVCWKSHSRSAEIAALALLSY
jgi:hypothetical protein